jgi:hypothetical protein
MTGKRERSEDVYGMVPQRLRDMVKAGLPASQCPVVELSHSSVARLETRRHRESWVKVSLMVRLARWTMPNEGIEGHEWGTYVALARFSGAEHGRAYKSRDSRSRSSRITQMGGL